MDQLIQATKDIKSALLNGEKPTTASGNRLGKTVDFRKIISRLRAGGMDIKDCWTENNGHRYKIYFCE